jgi:putative oxidoreductase
MKPIDLALLVLRLALGAVFVMHGLQKLIPGTVGGGEGIQGLVKILTDAKTPSPEVLAYVAAIWEVAGGALVAIGLFTRIAALGLLGIMFVAILTIHLKNGFFLPGYEFAMVLGTVALAIVVAGAGKVSLGAAFAKKGPPPQKKPG